MSKLQTPAGFDLKSLDKLTTEELLAANTAIVKLIKIRNVNRQLQASAGLRLRQQVKFTHSRTGVEHTIVITKINTKTIKGTEVGTNILWSVSPSMVRPA